MRWRTSNIQRGTSSSVRVLPAVDLDSNAIEKHNIAVSYQNTAEKLIVPFNIFTSRRKWPLADRPLTLRVTMTLTTHK